MADTRIPCGGGRLDGLGRGNRGTGRVRAMGERSGLVFWSVGGGSCVHINRSRGERFWWCCLEVAWRRRVEAIS